MRTTFIDYETMPLKPGNAEGGAMSTGTPNETAVERARRRGGLVADNGRPVKRRTKRMLRWDFVPMIIAGRKVLEASPNGCFRVSDLQGVEMPSAEKCVDINYKPKDFALLREGLEALGSGATLFVCTLLARRNDGTTYTINEDRSTRGVIALCYREVDGVLHYQPVRHFATALDAMDACDVWTVP